MDQFWAFIQGIAWLPAATFITLLLLTLLFFVRKRYMIAEANQALVITGGKKEPRILVGGSAFVPPTRKGSFFDLGLMTVTSTNEETQTTSMIKVVVEWTAQLRADTSRDENGQLNESLRNAILGFSNFRGDVAASLQQTLEGEVRAVVATMTPEGLVRNKADFAQQVDSGVRDSMAELGFKLVSLNIGKIDDLNDYYKNLAAKDREEKRQEAANVSADADQGIAIRRAEADESSKAAEQKRDLAIAEQQRELQIRQAAIQAETDTAKADAQIAGQLQREIRNQDLATREGEVAVVREQQRQKAAEARRAVELTDAETQKQTKAVEAEAAKQQAEIQAEAEARQSEIAAEAQANVARRKATGEAEAAVAKAQGEADAINKTTEAKANQVRKTGLAEAEVARAQGEAEAAAIRAKGEAEAEVQRKMAEALAANEGANLKVSIAEIESRTRIQVATALGTAMHEVGTNATIIDMGGNGSGQGGLLGNLLGGIPELAKVLDIKSQALNGEGFNDTLSGIVNAVTGKTNAKASQIGLPAIEADSVEEAPSNSLESTAATKAIGNLSLSDVPIEDFARRLNVDPGKAAMIADLVKNTLATGLPAEDTEQ